MRICSIKAVFHSTNQVVFYSFYLPFYCERWVIFQKKRKKKCRKNPPPKFVIVNRRIKHNNRFNIT